MMLVRYLSMPPGIFIGLPECDGDVLAGFVELNLILSLPSLVGCKKSSFVLARMLSFLRNRYLAYPLLIDTLHFAPFIRTLKLGSLSSSIDF